MSSLRLRLDALSPQQRARLAQELGRRQAAVQRGIPPAPRSGSGFPLSYAQERLWSMEQARQKPGRCSRGVWLRAAMDPDTLRRALAGVIARHEAWRTTFHVVDGQVAQRPGPAPQLHLPARRRPPSMSEDAHRMQVSRELIAAPFDLGEGPLHRFALLETGRPGIYTFVAVSHRLVFDSASEGVLLAELARAYLTLRGAALRGPARAEMPPLALQAVDHAVWERKEGERRWAGSLRVLTERLRGAPAQLELAAGRPRPAHPSGRGGAIPLRLEPGLVRRLRALSERAGATLSAPLLAGFAALLSRHGAPDDLVVGVPVANRGADPELRNLLGLFEDTAPVRLDLSGGPSFEVLLQRVAARHREALSHAELPLTRLLRGLQRAPPHAPLFRVGFDLQPALALPQDLGLPVEALGRVAPDADAELDLNLTLTEEAGPEGATGALLGRLGYDAERFDPDTVEALAQELIALLEGAAASPQTPIPARAGA